MLKEILIDHQIKRFFRTYGIERNLLSLLILSVIISAFSLLFIILLINLEGILSEGDIDPILKFNALIFIFLIIDFVIRCFFVSPFTSVNVIPYLRFNWNHSRYVNLLIVKNFFCLYNLIPLVLISVFSWGIIFEKHSLNVAINYQLSLTLLIAVNTYFASYFKYLILKRPFLYFIPASFPILLGFFEKIRDFVENISISYGNSLVDVNPLSLFILSFILCSVIFILRRLYLNSIYIDEIKVRVIKYISIKKVLTKSILPFNILIDYLFFDIKLLIRNRKLLQTISIYPILPIYIVISLINKQLSTEIAIINLVLLFGLFPILYGQFIFSWESTFFDGLMARKFDLICFIKSKCYLMNLVSFLVFIIVFMIFTLINKTVMLLVPIFLFSIGINNFIVLYFAIFNKTRIILHENFFLNYQSQNIPQLILPVFITFIPSLLIGILKLFFSLNTTLHFLGFIGISLIIIQNFWITKIILPSFMRRKYINLEGYRKISN
jgi:hypothetical protein